MSSEKTPEAAHFTGAGAPRRDQKPSIPAAISSIAAAPRTWRTMDGAARRSEPMRVRPRGLDERVAHLEPRAAGDHDRGELEGRVAAHERPDVAAVAHAHHVADDGAGARGRCR